MRECGSSNPGPRSTSRPSTRRTPGRLKGGRSAAVAALDSDRQALVEWQTRLWAESRRSLLLILQGTDASGKDGTIAHVFSGVNPQGTSVTAFKAPTAEELAHDFLWRVHRAVPHRGADRHLQSIPVRGRPGCARAQARPESRSGRSATTTSPRSSHCSPRVARPSSNAACSSPRTSNAGDSKNASRIRRNAGSSSAATSRIARSGRNIRPPIPRRSARTSTKDAPWYIIPADHKWYRNWVVSRLLIETLTEMDPKYPEPPDLAGITIT